MRQSGTGRYGDANANSNSQMVHAGQRTHVNSAPRYNQIPGRPDSYRSGDKHQYVSPKSQTQWKWERDESRGSDSLSNPYGEGQMNDASRSSYQSQWSENMNSLDKPVNAESRISPQGHGMDVRYNESSLPQTFEDLEQRFLEDISKLTKEQQDAEDAENSRHRERLNDINSQYQDKLLAMRTRQSSERDEFLRKESHARHHEYQQLNLSTYQSNVGDFRELTGTGSDASASLGEAVSRTYVGRQSNSYRDRPQVSGQPRDRGFDSRGPYPGGRAYNTGGRRF